MPELSVTFYLGPIAFTIHHFFTLLVQAKHRMFSTNHALHRPPMPYQSDWPRGLWTFSLFIGYLTLNHFGFVSLIGTALNMPRHIRASVCPYVSPSHSGIVSKKERRWMRSSAPGSPLSLAFWRQELLMGIEPIHVKSGRKEVNSCENSWAVHISPHSSQGSKNSRQLGEDSPILNATSRHISLTLHLSNSYDFYPERCNA